MMSARPAIVLGTVCVAVVAGLAAGLCLSGFSACWLAFAVISAVVGAIAYGAGMRFSHVLIAFLAVMVVTLRAESVRREALMRVERSLGSVDLVLTVRGNVSERCGVGSRWVSFASEFDGGGIRVVMPVLDGSPIPRSGESWRCVGWLERKRLDDRTTRRLWIKGANSHASRVNGGRNTLLAWMDDIRRGFSRRIGIGLADRKLEAGLLRAMVVGEKDGFDRRLRADFVSSGTVHVFAISGLHVVVIAHALCYVMLAIGIPSWIAGAIAIPFLWLYVLMIGMPPSAVRAASMASICYAAPMFWRRPDPIIAWELTLIVFAAVNPIGLFAVGSMLSFVVMLGILLFLEWERPFSGRVLKCFGVPFAAWIFGLPIAAHCFSQISIGGLFANLAMVPLACGAVMMSVTGVVTSFVSEWAAAHINGIAALFVDAMTGISWMVSRLPWSSVEVESWSVLFCLEFYALVVLIFVFIRLRYNSIGLAARVE